MPSINQTWYHTTVLGQHIREGEHYRDYEPSLLHMLMLSVQRKGLRKYLWKKHEYSPSQQKQNLFLNFRVLSNISYYTDDYQREPSMLD